MSPDLPRKSRQSKAEPLTPAKTPTSDIFEATPVLDTFESSFHDPRVTWDTANPCPSSPQDFTTPKSETDGDSRTGYQGKLNPDIDAELASHVHHLSPSLNLALPPVEPSRQLSYSPGPCSAKRTCLDALQVERTKEEPESTPGRTRASASPSRRQLVDRKPRRATEAAMAEQRPKKMSVFSTTRMGPPETPGRRVAASPQLFPSLQFSPDLFHTARSGPATAPSLPQSRLFWDPSSNPDDLPYQDPFGPPHPDLVTPFTPSPVTSHGFQSAASVSSAHAYDLPSAQSTQILAPPLSPIIGDSPHPVPFTASPRVAAPAPDDPSMFLSSPARRFGSAQPPMASLGSGNRPELQAYHHQLQESKREEEFQRAERANTKKSLAARNLTNVLKRPVSPPPNNRSGVKRSSIYCGIGDFYPRERRQSQVSFAEPVSVSHDGGRNPLSRRPPPLKIRSSDSHQNLNQARPRSRKSLSFTIDKDGRAKTVVTRIPDRPASRLDVDNELSESETDSLDATDFDIVRSQNSSFSFPEQEEQHRPLARLRYESKSHSKSSSYSSTTESSTSAYPSSRTSSGLGAARPRSRLPIDQFSEKAFPAQPKRNFTSFPAMNHHGVDATPNDENDENGDAQHALRAILKRRPRLVSADIAHIPPPQVNDTQNFHSSPPTTSNNNYGIFNASPTTITDPDLASPSTDRCSLTSGGSTRCICSSSSPDGQLMIQCESCSKWLHATCVGIDSNEIPVVYICVYCAQTPMRHGRVREPSRAAAMAPASPLAHKKGRYYR